MNVFSRFYSTKFQAFNGTSNALSIQLVVTTYHNLCNLIDSSNATLTFPLIFVVFHFFVANMLSLFNLFHAYFKNFENFYFVLLTEGSAVVCIYVGQALLMHSCCKLFEEASKTPVIISNILNVEVLDARCKKIFKNFLLQNQYRNLKLKTVFFDINWEFLLTVRFFNEMFEIKIKNPFFLGNFHNGDLFDHYMAIRTINIKSLILILLQFDCKMSSSMSQL